ALPAVGPLGLDSLEGRLFGHAGGHAGKRIGADGLRLSDLARRPAALAGDSERLPGVEHVRQHAIAPVRDRVVGNAERVCEGTGRVRQNAPEDADASTAEPDLAQARAPVTRGSRGPPACRLPCRAV